MYFTLKTVVVVKLIYVNHFLSKYLSSNNNSDSAPVNLKPKKMYLWNTCNYIFQHQLMILHTMQLPHPASALKNKLKLYIHKTKPFHTHQNLVWLSGNTLCHRVILWPSLVTRGNKSWRDFMLMWREIIFSHGSDRSKSHWRWRISRVWNPENHVLLSDGVRRNCRF